MINRLRLIDRAADVVVSNAGPPVLALGKKMPQLMRRAARGVHQVGAAEARPAEENLGIAAGDNAKRTHKAVKDTAPGLEVLTQQERMQSSWRHRHSPAEHCLATCRPPP